MDAKRVNILVSGIVQGVCFRYFAQQQAKHLGLTGWVRNLYNGKVEILAEGDDVNILELIKWSKHGPPHASVKNIEILWKSYQNEFSNFNIKY